METDSGFSSYSRRTGLSSRWPRRLRTDKPFTALASLLSRRFEKVCKIQKQTKNKSPQSLKRNKIIILRVP
jgi:hypothetical protein